MRVDQIQIRVEALPPATRCLYCAADAKPGRAVCDSLACAAKFARANTHELAMKAILAENAQHEQRMVDEHGYKLYLTVCAGPEIKTIAQMGRDLEANNDAPDLHWHRDGNGEIDGIILTGRLSRGTISRVPEIKAESLNGAGVLRGHRPWHPLFGPCACSDCLQKSEGGR